jgi:hypothetical protein
VLRTPIVTRSSLIESIITWIIFIKFGDEFKLYKDDPRDDTQRQASQGDQTSASIEF